MYKVRKLILIPILILNIYVIYLNSLRKESFKVQKVLLNDMSTGEFNLQLNQINDLNDQYPSLAINTIPIKTLKSRYLNFYNLKKESMSLLNISLLENPYSVYSFYLKSRILIDQNRNLEAISYLRQAFKISPGTTYSSSLYVTLLGDLKLYKELIDIFPQLKLIPDLNIWRFYISALKISTPNKNLQEIDSIISFGKNKFKNKKIFFNN